MILGYSKEDYVEPAGGDASLGWLTEFCGHGFPSRAVLLPYRNRLLSSVLFLEKKSSVRSVILGLSSESVIIRFFDVRDAVEFVFELISCFKYDESQIFFVCESVLKELTQILGWLEVPHPSKQKQHQDVLSSDNSGCLKVTLKVDETNDIHASVDSLIAKLKTYGRVLAYSDGWRDVGSPDLIKIFLEYYDSHHAQLAFDMSAGLQVNKGLPVSVAFCSLHVRDKDFLFFQQPKQSHEPEEDQIVTEEECREISKELSAEKKVIKRPQSKHHYSCSTVSLAFSSLSIPSDIHEPRSCQISDEEENSPNSTKPSTGTIDYGRIEQGSERRTTCMIRNIPNKYTQQMLIDLIDESHADRYDFIYLRMDFKNKCNVGYAFINFLHPSDVLSFAKRMLGHRWPRFNSEKICELSWARIQGKFALMDKFKHSRVMQEPPSYRPRTFDCKA